MAIYIVTSGLTSSGITLSGGDLLYVSSGGTVSDITINAGGQEFVGFGGTATDTVLNGGYAFVSRGGTASSTVIANGGQQIDDPGDMVTGTTIKTGGAEYVYGATTSTIIDNGGLQEVQFSDEAIGTVVNSGGSQLVHGGTAVDTIVNSGGTMTLVGGAQYFGGAQYLSSTMISPGMATGTVLSGGTEIVSSGGLATTTTVLSGGAVVVSSGGLASESTISSGTLVVLSGGTANFTTVGSAGQVTVFAGGSGISTTVAPGGFEQVSGGTATGAVVDSGGIETIESSGGSTGTTFATTVLSGGIEFVDIGGVATSATVSDGGYLIVVPGGIANAPTLLPGSIPVSTGVVVGQKGVGVTQLGNAIPDAVVGDGKAEFVLPGGTITGTTANSGGDVAVYSGGHATGTTVNSGGWQDVQPGGTATGTVISGGTEYLHSGGTATGTVVNGSASQFTYSAASQIVYSGGAATGTIVNSGAWQNLQFGGSATDTTVSSGGFEVLSGGSASLTTIQSGGALDFAYLPFASGGSASVNTGSDLLTVSVGGVTNSQQLSGTYAGARFALAPDGNGGTMVTLAGGSATIVNSGTLFVSSGVTSNGVVVDSGGTEIVLSGGRNVSGTVNGGGLLRVSSGGLDSGTMLDGTGSALATFGVEYVLTGATASATTLNAGGYEYILGGTATGVTVNGSGAQLGQMAVGYGGTATGTTVNNGGYEFVVTSGTDSGTTLNAGSYQNVDPEGIAIRTTVNNGAESFVAAAATASGTVVNPGGTEFISAGGIAVSTTVNSLGHFLVRGMADATAVYSGGTETVSAGGTASGTMLNPGGSIDVTYLTYASGGTAGVDPVSDLLTVSEGGQTYTQQLSGGYAGDAFLLAADTAGGTVITNKGFVGGIVGSGVTIYVSSGVTSVGLRLDSGGTEIVLSGGTADGISVNNGGSDVVSIGGIANFTVLSGLGAGQAVYPGGTANGVTVNTGGVQEVLGTANGTTVNSGGVEFTTLFSLARSTTVNASGHFNVGGVASGTTVNSGGQNIVDTGGATSGTLVFPGGQEVVGGTAIGTTVDGVEQLGGGGSALGAIVESGGAQIVSSGGVASNTVVNSGGVETVSSGGTTTGTTVSSGGFETLSGGTASNTVVLNGGTVAVSSGGAADFTTVGSLGMQFVSSGGIASGSTVDPGGLERLPGGTASSTLVGKSGFEIVSSGGTAIGTTVLSGGVEFVDRGATATGTTLNGGGYLIVAPGAVVNGTTVDPGGVVVSTGVVAVEVGSGVLQVSASFTDFILTGSGAAFVLPGGTAGETILNSGADLTVYAGGRAISTTVNGGAQQNVLTGGTATGTVVSGGTEFVHDGGTASGTVVDGNGASFAWSAGAQIPDYGGTATGTIVNGGGREIVTFGASASGTMLNSGGAIDVAYLPFVSGGSATVNSATGLLTVSVGGQTYTQQLAVTDVNNSFGLTSDPNNGTVITDDGINNANVSGITLASGGTLEIPGTLTPGEPIVFSPGAPETLILDEPTATISNPISGYALGDKIVVPSGITVNSVSVQNGDTMVVAFTSGGIPGSYVFTDVSFAPNTPLSFTRYGDPFANGIYIMPTYFLSWTGFSGTDFSTASNWNLGTIVPNGSDFASFANGVGGTITGSGSAAVANFFNTGAGFVVQNASLTATIGLSVGISGGGTSGEGALTIGAGATIDSEGYIYVGPDAGDVSTLTISGGGVLNGIAQGSTNLTMEVANAIASGALPAATGNVLVTGAGSMLNLGNNALYIGNAGGSGTVTVADGGSIVASSFNDNTLDPLSLGSHGNGILTVTDPGSQVTANGDAYIAHTGTGTLTVENSGSVLIEPDPVGIVGLQIGNGNQNGVGGTGIATVTGNGVLDDEGYMFVGLRGVEGQLSVLNGGTVKVGTTLYVADGGTITTNGSVPAGTTESASGTVTIGTGATLELTGAPQTSSYGIYLGDSNNGTKSTENALATVSGTGALLNTNGNGLAVGEYGEASLTVSQGGSVATGTANSSLIDAIAIGRQGSGTVTVTDPNSILTANGGAFIGKTGTGSLVVENHGSVAFGLDTVNDGNVHIGGGETNSTGALYVGGNGSALVATGGSVSAQGDIEVGDNGASGTLTVMGAAVSTAGPLRIGDSITLTPGATLISPSGTTVVTSATVEAGTGSVVVTGGTITAASLSLDADPGQTASGSLDISAGGAVDLSGNGAVNASGGITLDGGYLNVATTTAGNGGELTLAAGGSVTGAGQIAVGQTGAGTLTNAGSITASGGAIGLTIGALVNSGAIEGAAASALILQTGGTLTNRISGTIGGGIQFAGGAGTVSNAGSMNAVLLAAGFPNLVTFDPGASFNGTVDGGNTIGATSASVLELAAGPGSGTLSGLGSLYVDFARTTVDTGATWTVTSANTLAAGTTLTNNGTMILSNAILTDSGTIDNNGSMTVDPSTLTVADLTGTGTVTIDNGSTVTTQGSVAAGQTIAFDGTNAELNLSVPDFAGTIVGFAATDKVVLSGITNATSAKVVNGNTLQIQNTGSPPITVVLDPNQNYTGVTFGVVAGGTITDDLGRTMLWTGGTSTDFNTAANWDDLTDGLNPATAAPNPTDTVEFNASGGAISGSGTAAAVLVGSGGSGVLQMSAGATLVAATLDAGVAASDVGQIGLTGPGTELSLTGAATVADDGTGVLSVLSGATFAAGSLTIGSQADSSGALVVSGAGSVINLTGALNIGTANGTGDITVGPNAAVHAGVVNLQGQAVVEGGLLDPTVQLIGQGQTAGGYGTISAGDIIDEGVVQAGQSKASQRRLLVQGTIVGGGTLSINGTVQPSKPAGVLQVNAGGTLELTGAVLNAATTTFTDNLTPADTYTVTNSVMDVDFADAAGVLIIDDIAGFAGTIATAVAGDRFLIPGGTLSAPTVINGNTLQFSDSGAGAGPGGKDQIIFASPISAAGFGTLNNTVQVACFAEGTRIETASGPVAVENLRMGDRVVRIGATAARPTNVSGKSAGTEQDAPIVWIGQRTVDCQRHPDPRSVWPVRITAGAFGENVPVRDLYLSPDHAVFVNGVLMPVKLLINGATIRQVTRNTIIYFHVELPCHEVILAEDLPVESYLDTGDRTNFSTNGEAIRLFPDFNTRLKTPLVWETKAAAPLVMTGPKLTAARNLVAARATRHENVRVSGPARPRPS